jgi:RNA polymerase-binding protein DksA
MDRLARLLPSSPSITGRPEEDRQMEEIRDDLQRKRRALEIMIETAKGQGRGETERSEITKDPYGTASLTHDDEMVADVAARRKRDLQRIDRALADLDAGRYGKCEDCDEPIAPKRLKALPFATRCVACQAATEQYRRAA